MKLGVRMRRRLGAAIWFFGVGAAVLWSWQQAREPTVFPGLGREMVIEIASEVDGRLNTLEVDLHDEVQVGEIVARLQEEHVAIQREIAAAQLLAVAQTPETSPDEAIRSTRDTARRKQIRLEIEAVNARVASLEALLASGAATRSELDGALARREELRRRLARSADRTPEDPGSTWDVVAALRRLDAVEARLEALSLRTSMAGRVAAVHRRPGEVVRRGEPLLTIEDPSAEEVLTWVSTTRIPAVGTPVTVQRADGSRLAGQIVSVSAGPTLLPEQVWTLPGRPQYGVPVRVQLDGASVRPREPVRVLL